MRSVVLAAPNYPPESNAAAKRIASIAEHLSATGWRVSVVTLLPHYPQNALYPDWDVPSPHVEDVNGVKVIRIRPWIVPRDDLALRLMSETLFCVQCLPHLLRSGADVVVASSPYMFLGLTGWLGSRLQGRRFVWDVRDLTWLYPAATGKKTWGLDRALGALMKRLARGADGLATATEGLLAYFPAPPRLAEVIPNGVSDDLLAALGRFEPPSAGAAPRVVYAGLFGFNHGVITILEAARQLPDVSFILAGDGPQREQLEAFVELHGLENVRILGYLGRSDLLALYESATILVSHVRRSPIFRWTQPAKLWEFMATRRPVVHAGEGEAIEILGTHQIALTVPPEDPGALASAIRSLIDDPARSAQLGERGRRYVEERRRSARLVEEFAHLLRRVTADDPTGRRGDDGSPH